MDLIQPVTATGAPPVSDQLRERVSRTGTPALAAWTPDRGISLGPRDRHASGYERAVAAATERGFPVRTRRMGGRPVALTENTLAFVWAVPAGDGDIRGRYRALQAVLVRALAEVGVEAAPGEPPDSFCPGTHGLRATGKLAGFAQRVHADVAGVGGIVIVDDHAEIAEVLEPVYAALDLPLDPDSVGSVSRAGGAATPDGVRTAIVEAFRADRSI